VLDILLIEALGELNYAETAQAALHVFNERGAHSFPPAFVMPAEWRPELEAMAADLEFHIRTAEAIEQRFREIIKALDQNAKTS
jgi:hypothetical protein